MQRGISDEEFDQLSKEKQKQYIAKWIIANSDAQSVSEPEMPLAIVMAGLPGAGKTEFLDTFSELLLKTKLNPFVRIDLDQIVTVYPGYTPERYAKFRNQGNHALVRTIDLGKDGRYNMMIDGTFAGESEASINNIQRLLDSGYQVMICYMHDNPETAWGYTKSREVETKRGIDFDGFKRACKNIPLNLKTALNRFDKNEYFSISIILQKELRDKEYKVITERTDIDKIIATGYNIDNLKES